MMLYVRTTITKSFFLFLMASMTVNVYGVSYTEHKSSVPGVGLWSFDMSPQPATEIFINEGKSEFSVLCDNKGKIYIYELNSQGYNCISKNHGIQDGDRMESYSISLLNVPANVFGFGKIYTVSTHKIEQPNWTSGLLSLKEVKPIKSMVSNSVRRKKVDKENKYIDVAGTMLERSQKIHLESFDLMIIPTQRIVARDDSGQSLLSTVLLKKGEKYQIVGHIQGCFNRVGADIDGDCIPEVLFDNGCENGDAEYVVYYKLYPNVSRLIEFGAN